VNVTIPAALPLISDPSHLAALQAMNETGTLIVQVTIPKCGTTALKFILKYAWLKLFHSSNITIVKSLPYLAGDCESPKSDGMENCVAHRNFPCLATPRNKKGEHSCMFRPASNHLGLSELRGFLAERGIDLRSIPRPRLVFLSVFREPTARVASEFFQWKRNWCCGWFFSANMTLNRANMSLLEFVEHEDCPANNRQTWMLADLPMIQRNPENDFSFFSPSEFRDYLKRRYLGAADYVAQLNRDESILRSAENFLGVADVVGITERMEMTLAMTLFSFPAGRENFFTYRTPRKLSKQSLFSSAAGRNSLEEGEGRGRPNMGEAAKARSQVLVEGCWELKEEGGLAVRHDRRAEYAVQPNEHEAIRVRNKLDLRFYDKALVAHERLVEKYRLCGEEEEAAAQEIEE
jgi:hypothetical protein